MSQSDRQFELLEDCEQRTLQNCENLEKLHSQISFKDLVSLMNEFYAPKFSVSFRKGKGIDPLHSPLLS